MPSFSNYTESEIEEKVKELGTITDSIAAFEAKRIYSELDVLVEAMFRAGLEGSIHYFLLSTALQAIYKVNIELNGGL